MLALAGMLTAACGSSSSSGARPAAATPSLPGTSAAPDVSSGVCGNGGAAPGRYQSVVVFAFENRTWSRVGLGFGPAMPYLHRLGQECSYFTNWTEADTRQNSETQYVGQMTGARQPRTLRDCQPSITCSTRADNLFRQARRAGLKAINYVEDVTPGTTGCSGRGEGRRKPTIPDLFMWGSDDRAFCEQQVRPYSEFNPNALPNFAFITPNMCDNGHDCPDTVVDAWAKRHIQPVLNSTAYREGHVAVFVWYDEDHPVPNLWITPTANAGPITIRGTGYAGTLKAWDSMLGLPCLANACFAHDMRAAANS